MTRSSLGRLSRGTRFVPALVGASIATVAVASPFRYAEDHAPAVVNPLFATSMSEARIDELVFEPLFTDDLDLRSAPALASGSTLAADHKSMTIDLRDGVTWHDGQPFVAKDVVFTIQAMKDSGTASSEAGRVGWIKSVTAVTDHQVKITFVGEEWAPEEKLHFKILPAHAFTGTTIKRTDAFRTHPIGTGPFQLTSFNADNSVTMTKFDAWHGDPHLDEVQMREVADTTYQAKLLMYESLEALVRVLPRDLAPLQNDRKVELYPYQTNSWWYVGFNLAKPTLADVRVREALHDMVDVETLLAPIGTGDVLTGPFVKSSPFYNHDVPFQPANVEGAKAKLTEAGWTFSGRQWMKDGQPLKITITAPDNLETAQDVVINLQSQLQAQGIVVEPEFLGVAEWKDRVWSKHAYDVILSQWSFDRNEDIYDQFHSGGSRNFGSYASPDVDTLLDQARATPDPQQKKALLRQVHAKVAADQPMIFLWTLDSYAAMSTRVKNVVVHPFYFFTWADQWSVE
jgi:peptide/nickel transport system substrate-binding protein